MLQFFRQGIKSKLGIGIALSFLILIGLSFGLGDVSNNSMFGGIAGGDRVATVGDSRIDTADLERTATNVVDNMRRQDPAVTMRSFVASGKLTELLDYLIARRATLEFGNSQGMHIGSRLIDSEIAKLPGVQGPDGKVDPLRYQQYIAQRRETDAQFRLGLEEDLMARQLIAATRIGLKSPQSVVLRYAGVVTERRKGAIAILPSAAFAPKAPPSEAEVKAWYNGHLADYQLPERRTVRYVVFDESVVKAVPAPTEAEIAARYKANKALYAPSDKRKLAQMVVPTEAAGKAVLAEVAAGKALEAAAAVKGLGVAVLGPVSREEYALQSSAAAAEAVFAAPQGKLAGPFKAPLGWLVVRIDGTERKPGKSLDQARAEISAALAAEKRRAALTEFSASIEDEFDNGASLADMAKELGQTPLTTAPLLPDGSVFGQPGATAPAVLAPVLATAFAMEREGQPQLAEIEPGKTFIVFDVGALTSAAPQPLAEIRPRVVEDVQLSKGAKAAAAAAKKVEAAMAKGVPIEVAMASLGVALPPVDRVDQARMEIQAMGPNAPRPLVLFFAMPKGKIKLMAAPRNRGWYVLTVSEVSFGKVDPRDGRLPGLVQSLQQAQGEEYADQLAKAMQAAVGAERNETAIGAVRKRLQGGS
jgi:peptidyl-prolyl cis-trans isomerase D